MINFTAPLEARQPMFKKTIYFLTLLVFSLNARAECSDIAEGYEDSDTVYVVCKTLDKVSDQEARIIIDKLFSQYVGPPDEILVYFIRSKNSIGKTNFNKGELSGFYYTHENKLSIWSENNHVKREIEIN